MSSSNNFLRFVMPGCAVLALLAIGFVIGRQDASGGFSKSAFAGFPLVDNAARGKSMSMATGYVESGVEALYALDHLTGDLFCWVLNARTGAVASTFRVSAGGALGVVGEADYVMTTGLMDFAGGVDGNMRPAQSVVYVGDGNTGKVVGYVLMYNRTAIQRGEALASGEFRLVSEMVTREVGRVRDQGK